jgi:hypothetical protein
MFSQPGIETGLIFQKNPGSFEILSSNQNKDCLEDGF